MNDFSTHVTKTRYQALADLLTRCSFSPQTEMVPLDQACGRVLAQDLISKNTLPNSLTSAMDAIAVHFDDFSKGIPDTSEWKAGEQFVFANTGIGIAGDYDTCIMIENTHFDENGVLTILNAPSERGEKTIPVGTTMRAGDLLVEAGAELTPALLGLAAQAGYTELQVVRKPRVGFIPSGNELVAAGLSGDDVPARKNVECNSVVIAAKLRQWGAEPIVHDICPDVWDVIEKAITDMLVTCDILIVNAGSSKGTDDLTIEILEEMGEVLNHEFDHGPGRHSSLSVVDGKPVIGVSGPPLGAEFCVDWYVKPVVDAFFGRTMEPAHTMWATLAEDMPMRPRPVTVVRRVRLERSDDGYLYAIPLGNDIKPALKMCDMSDGFLVVDKDSHGFSRGDRVAVELRYPYTLPV